MNDISNSVAGSKIKLFTDDTNMFVEAKSINEYIGCNIYLHDLNEWFLANKLSLMVSKTCFTLFQPYLQNSVQQFLNLEIDSPQSLCYS